MGPREFTVLISMLMALTALAIDMMLPAFSSMRGAFGLEEGSAAVAPVVTSFLLGLGLGQLIWGSASDALGRKPVLWAGVAVYIAGGVGAALSPSLGMLLAWRFISGMGAGAVRAVAIGAVRDRYRGSGGPGVRRIGDPAGRRGRGHGHGRVRVLPLGGCRVGTLGRHRDRRALTRPGLAGPPLDGDADEAFATASTSWWMPWLTAVRRPGCRPGR
jgi:MFS family permease